MDATDIVVRYSGDGTPAGSLGGAIHANEVTSQSIASTTIGGIVIERVVNLPSSVVLSCSPSGADRIIGWIGPTFLKGYITVSAAGPAEYTIYSPSGDPADGYMVVTVTKASTPGSYTEETLAVTTLTEKIFPNVTSAEAGTGSYEYEYRCVYIRNDHGSETIATLKLWIGKQYDGEETVAFAVDSNGVGGTAATIVDGDDSTDVLSGLSFVSPTTEATGVTVSTIANGVSVPIWIRRRIDPSVQTALSLDSFGISIAAYV